MSKKKLAVGIDIGGTNTVFGLVDKEGNIYGEGHRPTADYEDFTEYVTEVCEGIKQLVENVGFPVELIGIGVGSPMGNVHTGTIDHAANLRWKGVLPLADEIRRHFAEIPVIVTNDANAGAVGEMVYGNAKGMKDFIFITLGTGVGSGFVAGGELIYGNDGLAGELGHMVIDHSGRQCGCGRKGCLETYVSATGIKRTVFKLLADDLRPSEFRDVSFNDLTAEMITAAALKGDCIAIEAFEYTGKLLGRVLADAVTITSPEAIFLFGGLSKAGKYLFEPTKRNMDDNMLSIFRDKVKLLPSGMICNAAILGSSSLVWKEVGKSLD